MQFNVNIFVDSASNNRSILIVPINITFLLSKDETIVVLSNESGNLGPKNEIYLSFKKTNIEKKNIKKKFFAVSSEMLKNISTNLLSNFE